MSNLYNYELDMENDIATETAKKTILNCLDDDKILEYLNSQGLDTEQKFIVYTQIETIVELIKKFE